MKKLFFSLLIIILLCYSSIPQENNTAFASAQYAMVVFSDTPLYADASLKIVKFYIPKTYFVKVISIDSEYSRVIYMDDSSKYPSSEGYVKTANLDFSFEQVSTPYPSIELTSLCDEVLFADNEKQIPKTVITSSSKAIFYGEALINGDSYLYVYSQGNVGYAKKSSFSSFEIPDHPLYVEKIENENNSISDEDAENSRPEQNQSFDAYKIVLIILIVATILCLIYFALRSEKKQQKASLFKDFDEF